MGSSWPHQEKLPGKTTPAEIKALAREIRAGGDGEGMMLFHETYMYINTYVYMYIYIDIYKYICIYVYMYIYIYIYMYIHIYILYTIWLCIYFRCSAHEALAKFPEQQIKLFHGNISLPGKKSGEYSDLLEDFFACKGLLTAEAFLIFIPWLCNHCNSSMEHLLIHSFGLKTRCGNQTIWATFQWPSFLSNPWHPCKHTLLPCYTSTVWFRTCMRLCSNCRNSKTFWPLWIYLASLHQCWTSPLQFGVSLQQPRFIAFEQ